MPVSFWDIHKRNDDEICNLNERKNDTSDENAYK